MYVYVQCAYIIIRKNKVHIYVVIIALYKLGIFTHKNSNHIQVYVRAK